ncbi:glycerophosphodiester phosphodiesterase family protein [Sphingomonas sp. KR3-1]|uniref:glycerophosphodiester phosphodiesterase family protein n=1 Tax=Sphingomonas sp. KR3-1 TaxID=3156611 RepID=UPI0032B3E417
MALVSTSVAAAPGVRDRFGGTSARILVVAHRGCHNAAPGHGLPSAPENSIAALENCVRIGADMMETDVRQTADGELVMIHDDTLERTTTGSGRVRNKTLAELRTLRLRENLGGKDAAPTDQRIATLDEMLAAAHGRMHLNLDVKDAIYVEVIAAVERAGMQDQVIVKTVAGPNSPALAALSPYDRVPFAPILLNPHGDADLGAIALRQTAGKRPIAIELPQMSPEQLPAVVAHANGVRLWVNTLWSGFITGWGGDAAALRDPDQVWGRMYRAGISIFQTDEPEALLAFRATQRL